MTYLARLFRVRAGEAGALLMLGGLLLGNSLAMQVSYVTSVSGFLAETEVSHILIVWLATSLLFIPLTGLQSLIVDRFSRFRLLAFIIFAFALAFAALRLMFVLEAPGWLNYALLYLLAELQWLLFPLVFWALANDMFDMTQAKRLFPVIGSIGFGGRIVGLVLAMFAPALVALWGLRLEDLLVFNAIIYLLSLVVVFAWLKRRGSQSVSRSQDGFFASLLEGRTFVQSVASFRYLAAALVGLAICETIIEYHFLLVSNRAFATQESYQVFYGGFRLGITLAAMLVQGFATSRIIEWIGLKNTYAISPLSILGGAFALLLHPGLIVAVGAMSVLRIVRDTVEESSIKALQSLVPGERRGRVSVFMDGYLAYLGSVFGCMIALGILQLGAWIDERTTTLIYLATACVFGAASAYSILMMRKVYEQSLLNWRLKRRHRGASVLNKLDL